ncbi:MAG: radical SAM protein, partial [Deltaproteobacteria bacterium]
MREEDRRSEMYYAEPVYRPPSEAYSLLVQATVGCSSAAAGRCYFCNSTVFNRAIPEKKFRIRPTDEILEDIEIGGRQYGKGVDKIFLLDSNAMIIKTPELLKIVKKCYEIFPKLKQVSCYACCEDILRKTHEELLDLRKAGLNLVFVGLESGDQEVLNLINKGVTVENQIEAVVKANKA